MIRKTTPTHTWTLSIPVDTISKIEAYYSVNKKLVLKKRTEDFALNDNTATVKLTSKETLLFPNDSFVDVQLFVKTVDGEVIGTTVQKVYCAECLCDEVIE